MVLTKISKGVLRNGNTYNILTMALITLTIMNILKIEFESFSIISKKIVAQQQTVPIAFMIT